MFTAKNAATYQKPSRRGAIMAIFEENDLVNPDCTSRHPDDVGTILSIDNFTFTAQVLWKDKGFLGKITYTEERWPIKNLKHIEGKSHGL
jgi:hypothetical protein